MKKTIRTSLLSVIAAAVLASGTYSLAEAGMMTGAATALGQQHGALIHVVKRRIVHHRVYRRRHGIGPAAALGLFGAVIGAGIASERYDNYSNYAYGQPYYSYGQPYYAYQQPYPYAGQHPYERHFHRR